MNSLKPKTAHTASKIAEKMPTHGSFRGIEWMGLGNGILHPMEWNGNRFEILQLSGSQILRRRKSLVVLYLYASLVVPFVPAQEKKNILIYIFI